MERPPSVAARAVLDAFDDVLGLRLERLARQVQEFADDDGGGEQEFDPDDDGDDGHEPERLAVRDVAVRSGEQRVEDALLGLPEVLVEGRRRDVQ